MGFYIGEERSHPLTRLWGYILIFARVAMSAIYTILPADKRVLCAFCLILICMIMALGTYRWYPFVGGGITNRISVWGWCGLLILAVCQLAAEIQISGKVKPGE